MARIYMSEIEDGKLLFKTIAKNQGTNVDGQYVYDNEGTCEIVSINYVGGSGRLYMAQGAYQYLNVAAKQTALICGVAVCDESDTALTVEVKYLDKVISRGITTVNEKIETLTFRKYGIADVAMYAYKAGILPNANTSATNHALWNEYCTKEFGSSNIWHLDNYGSRYFATTGYLGGNGSWESYETTFYIGHDDRCETYEETRGLIVNGFPTLLVTKLDWFTTTNPVDTYTPIYSLLGAKGESEYKFTFDVYLDGNKEPNIAVQWNAVRTGGSFSGQLTKAHMWFYPLGVVNHLTTELNDRYIRVPSENENVYHSNIEKPFLDGEYRTTWSNACESVNSLGKIAKYAYLGTLSLQPTLIQLYLRLDAYQNNEQQDGFSVLHRVDIPINLPETADNINVVNVTDATGDLTAWLLNDWEVSVRVHFGEATENTDPRHEHSENDDGSGKGKYDPDEDKPNPSDFDMGSGIETAGLLTSTYAMSAPRLQSLGAKLWTQSYFDVLKIQTNPIENIVAVKAFPFPISGIEKSVVIGNIDMGVNGLKSSSSIKFTIGELNVVEKYHSFLDYGSFTRLTIFLPYIGFKDLDTSQFMTTKLKVEYAVDFISGACKAIIYSDNIPIHEFEGTMGIDVPLTSSDRAQTDLKHLQSLVNSGASLVGKDVVGAVNTALSGAQLEYNTSTTSGGTPTCSSYSCRNVFLIYDRPLYYDIKAFNHTHGRKCNLTKKIGDLNGFTKTSRNIDLTGVSATEREKDMIVDILSNGFYV